MIPQPINKDMQLFGSIPLETEFVYAKKRYIKTSKAIARCICGGQYNKVYFLPGAVVQVCRLTTCQSNG